MAYKTPKERALDEGRRILKSPGRTGLTFSDIERIIYIAINEAKREVLLDDVYRLVQGVTTYCEDDDEFISNLQKDYDKIIKKHLGENHGRKEYHRTE